MNPNNGYTKASQEGFYNSKEWKQLRSKVLEGNPFCVRCLESGKYEPANVVNHIRPVEQFPELKLEITNCESVCERCHRIITRQDHSRYNRFRIIEAKKIKEYLDGLGG